MKGNFLGERSQEIERSLAQNRNRFRSAIEVFKEDFEYQRQKGFNAEFLKIRAKALNELIHRFNFEDESLVDLQMEMLQTIDLASELTQKLLLICYAHGISDLEIDAHLIYSLDELSELVEEYRGHSMSYIRPGTFEIIRVPVPNFRTPIFHRTSYEQRLNEQLQKHKLDQ